MQLQQISNRAREKPYNVKGKWDKKWQKQPNVNQWWALHKTHFI